jgi:pyruvate kinase
MSRRTCILATLGPATGDRAAVAALIAAGVDAVRLNFSHGSLDEHRRMVDIVRAAALDADRSIAILQDLSGPKIRIGPVAAPGMSLREGDSLEIGLGDFVGEGGRVSCALAEFFLAVSVGQRVLVDDGRLELDVVETTSNNVRARVTTGGLLTGGKGLNLPNVTVPIAALTPKDYADLRAGVEMGIDLLALSFVQGPEDVHLARQALRAAGAPDTPIIAKIEKPQAVRQIDAITAAADGVMVARGDLGIELPLERLPTTQKEIVHAARRQGVPVIVATQVLESMREAPRPTRAEVTDAAHAVDESVDAIMLAGETAVGRYPDRAVRTLDAIIREAERAAVADGRYDEVHPADFSRLVGEPHAVALCEAAVALARRSGAAAIIAMTQAGKTARTLAAMRPAARVIAATPNATTAARLALVWGVQPVVVPAPTLTAVREAVLARRLVDPGAVLVFVSVHTVLGREDSNFMHVERL